jgi:hypothetical protein
MKKGSPSSVDPFFISMLVLPAVVGEFDGVGY